MVNNVYKTTATLIAELGRTTTFTSETNKTNITGELGLGCLMFDLVGTLGVITEYTNEDNFVVTTYALSIDVSSILSLSY